MSCCGCGQEARFVTAKAAFFVCSHACAHAQLGAEAACEAPTDMTQPDWINRYFDPQLNSAARVIGYGGQGQVYANERDQPQWVVKRAQQYASPDEFNVNCTLRRGTMEAYGMEHLVRVVHSPLLHGNDMVMERVVHPVRAAALLSASPDYSPRVALQALVGVSRAGDDNHGIVRASRGRGLFVDLETTAALIVHADEEEEVYVMKRKLVADLATFIATVQYGLQFDGLDMEFIVGHTTTDSRDRLYCIDFDRVRHHDKSEYQAALKTPKNQFNELVDSFARALDSVEYFPMAREHPLATLFATHYVARATFYDATYEALARRVLDDAAL